MTTPDDATRLMLALDRHSIEDVRAIFSRPGAADLPLVDMLPELLDWDCPEVTLLFLKHLRGLESLRSVSDTYLTALVICPDCQFVRQCLEYYRRLYNIKS